MISQVGYIHSNHAKSETLTDSSETCQVSRDTSTWPSKSGHLYYIVWPDFEGYVEVSRDTWQVSRDTSTWPSKLGHLYYIVWPDFEGYVEVSHDTWQVSHDTFLIVAVIGLSIVEQLQFASYLVCDTL